MYDAIEQYKRDRLSHDKLFEFARCIAHFAVDDSGVHFCGHVIGKAPWFPPFNQGWNDGAGNSPNPRVSRPITYGSTSLRRAD